ncbi:MAG: class I SAM-dependent methyltransferase [Gemmatimonadota bacterium]|nr:class I SAM-dependent methyltransferase [Gemmatimonadota bacterium]
MVLVGGGVAQGRAVGLDLWSQKDLAYNRREATLANARAESVADRVDVRDGDMRQMPFNDATFGAVMSSLAIHNVSSRAERRRAITEVVRMLRPDRQVALMDIAHGGWYADDLRSAGLRQVDIVGYSPLIFPPTRVLVGESEVAWL